MHEKIPEITPQEAKAACGCDTKTIILDVRETEEWNEGHIPGSTHISRGFLEFKIERVISDKTTPVICQCASGRRSLLAATTLRSLGFTNVQSMAGGIKAWKEAGFPIEGTAKDEGLTDAQCIRYGRHVSLPEVGKEGQLKLLHARVLVVGVGGLGSPAAFYLAAAGVGTIGIVDFDAVDPSNLQRQILHTTARIGMSKVDSAKESLLALNPDIKIVPHNMKLTSENVLDLFKNYDVIVDGSDNFSTRYLANDACVYLRKPLVHGSVYRFEGQASVFWPGKGPCYRCLFPEPPAAELGPSCAEAGVLGVVPGMIGMIEATEVIKIILGKGDLLVGRLLCYDALRQGFRELKLKRNPDCRYCGEGKPFPGFAETQGCCHV